MPEALNLLIPANMATASKLTAADVAIIMGIATLVVFGTLAMYAISKGYTVRRKGNEWIFEPPAKR